MTDQENGLRDGAHPAADSGQALRQKAEALVQGQATRTPGDSASLSPEDLRQTLHELRVHQIELEIQNEELRRAQAEIEAGRARYFDLYDMAPVGYCTLSEQGLILEANLTAATLLGTARGALTRLPFSRFILRDDQDIYYLHSRTLFETGKPQEYELRLVRPDGASFWAHWTATAAQAEDGGPVCRVAINDIDERKRAEERSQRLQEQLSQAQKIESIGRLAGGVAHNFNNMLGVILGNLEFALERIGPDDPLGADLEEIRKAAQRSASLTRQLLAFARKQMVQPRSLDLNDAVEGLLKTLRRLIGEDIALDWRPGRGLWPVRMDPAQVEQILVNLCLNARDAIAGVGGISVETRNAALGERFCSQRAGFTPGEYVTLVVKDDGCGMDDKTLSFLFEPFFTTKEMGKGAGLGLATVYGIVKQNDGVIDVCSKRGQGSTFDIYLPRCAPEDAPLP